MDDIEYSAKLRTMLELAFINEDKPMLEMQQQRMGGVPLAALNPALLPIDAGSVQVRRQLDKLIANEQADKRNDNGASA